MSEPERDDLAEAPRIYVSVAYVEGAEHFWRGLEVPAGTTAAQAVAESGLQQRFPHLDLQQLKLGVFSKPVKADRELEDGDRVEVYRPIIADPEAEGGNDA
ncbi:MAG: RnfH family protein [Halorhodospira sp.]